MTSKEFMPLENNPELSGEQAPPITKEITQLIENRVSYKQALIRLVSSIKFSDHSIDTFQPKEPVLKEKFQSKVVETAFGTFEVSSRYNF